MSIKTPIILIIIITGITLATAHFESKASGVEVAQAASEKLAGSDVETKIKSTVEAKVIAAGSAISRYVQNQPENSLPAKIAPEQPVYVSAPTPVAEPVREFAYTVQSPRPVYQSPVRNINVVATNPKPISRASEKPEMTFGETFYERGNWDL